MANKLDTNVLYYGDNLEIMRRYIPDNSIALVYLDPPFNSNRRYNVLFKDSEGTASGAQIQAFSDTWKWDKPAEQTYNELVLNGPLRVSKMIESLREVVGSNDMMAYLVMMTIRMVELRRVLNRNGSIYLHCDPTASHYLKVMMDTIFGVEQFRNDIIWKRTSAHSDAKRYGRVNDSLLFYSKGRKWTWNPQYQPYDEEYRKRFRRKDADGRAWSDYSLSAKGLSGGGYEYEYKGITSLWRVPPETMKRLDAEGRLHFTSRGGIRRKRYLDEMKGTLMSSSWTDIPPINSQAKERIGYDTQKPLALLERIIKASSNPGDVVLDPFLGGGTSVVAAEMLGRRWIGIDITHLAISVTRKRLSDSFPNLPYDVVGEPKDLGGARALALQDRYQFQWWALSLVNAMPVGGMRKKGADQGIDGVIKFIDNGRGRSRRIIVQVKSGRVGVRDIRELKAVAGERDLGLFLTLQPPTAPMLREAVTAGYHHSPLWQRDYPRIQIVTVEQLLSGQSPDLPVTSARVGGFAKAPRLNNNGSQMTIAEHQKAYTA